MGISACILKFKALLLARCFDDDGKPGRRHCRPSRALTPEHASSAEWHHTGDPAVCTHRNVRQVLNGPRQASPPSVRGPCHKVCADIPRLVSRVRLSGRPGFELLQLGQRPIAEGHHPIGAQNGADAVGGSGIRLLKARLGFGDAPKFHRLDQTAADA